MISYLKGKILHRGEDAAILLTGGVGYKVFLGEQTLSGLREGQETELFCAARLRGEALELYGVPSARALQVFEAVDKISGVGPKAALALSSFESMAQLKAQLVSGKLRVKGIGQKKLQKILLELDGSIDLRPAQSREKDEAVEGLASLGFTRSQAREALSQVSPDITSLQERVKEALRFIR